MAYDLCKTNQQAFYELCAKWIKLPPFGLKFQYKGQSYEIIGIVQAGNKLRARSAEGKVFLFEAKNFFDKYKIRKPDSV